MPSQFPINYEEIDSDEEKENAKFKKILNQIKQKQQSSESAKKRKVCEEISSQSYATIEATTKNIAQHFKQQHASKIEELGQKLERLSARASVGRQKLLEAKKSCIDAVEVHRESLKRLLFSLKEHEKETVAMRDVILKETTEKEMARAVAQVGQLGLLLIWFLILTLILFVKFTHAERISDQREARAAGEVIAEDPAGQFQGGRHDETHEADVVDCWTLIVACPT
jgi:hypothetical protein